MGLAMAKPKLTRGGDEAERHHVIDGGSELVDGAAQVDLGWRSRVPEQLAWERRHVEVGHDVP